MRLEELAPKTRCGPLDYLVLCDEKRLCRLARVEGRWVVERLSWCSTKQYYAPETARLLRYASIPFALRFELDKVPEEGLSEYIFARYRVSPEQDQLVLMD